MSTSPTPETGNGAKASSITIFDGKWSIQDLYDVARKVCGSPETPAVKMSSDSEASTRERDEFASWWKEIESLGRDELLDKVNKLTAQRDEWKDVAANAERATQRAKRERDELCKKYRDHHAEVDRLATENQSLNLQLSTSLMMLKAKERRHEEEVAKLNANYLAVMVERDRLAFWKKEAMTVESWWAKIDAFVRSHPSVTVGAVVADEALRMLREWEAPKVCPFCNWSNSELLNYGTVGKPNWLCHGCATREIQSISK